MTLATIKIEPKQIAFTLEMYLKKNLPVKKEELIYAKAYTLIIIPK